MKRPNEVECTHQKNACVFVINCLNESQSYFANEQGDRMSRKVAGAR